MGTGYTFNENILFYKSKRELARRTNTESLVACEETALLQIPINVFKEMAGGGQLMHGSSPHLVDDQDLLWELFERHFIVKSMLRLENGLIAEMPRLRSADLGK